MWPMLKILLTIIQLGLFLLAIFLSIANMDERYNRNKTTTNTYQASLSDIEFPVKFSILIYPGFSEEYLALVGYDNPEEYFSGNYGNEDPDGQFSWNYGWTGHSQFAATVSGIRDKMNFFFNNFFHFKKLLRISACLQFQIY